MREYIVYFESYFHPRIAFDNNDDFQMPLYTMFEKKYGIIVKRSSENIKAMLAGRIAKKLDSSESDPVLSGERFVSDAGDRPPKITCVTTDLINLLILMISKRHQFFS